MSKYLFSRFGILAAASLIVGCHTADPAAVLESRDQLAPRTSGNDSRTDSPYGTRLPSPRTGPIGKTETIQGSGRFLGDAPNRNDVDSETFVRDGVTLNLTNVTVQQAAKAVMGDILRVNYVVDPKVEGRVSLVTPRPMSQEGLASLFQSALRIANAALVENGDHYKIVPLDQAAQSGGPIRIASRFSDAQRLGEGIELVQLRFVSASDMKRVLEPLAPKGGIIRADEARNVISLSGNPQEIASMRDSIKIFDTDTMRGMSFAIVPVRSSDPDTLAEDLKTVFATEKEGPMSGMVRFIGNKRLSAVLVISPQTRYLSRAETWIRKLDARAVGSDKQFFTYRVQNRPAKELVGILNIMFASENNTATKSSNITPKSQPATIQSSGAGSTFGGVVGSANSNAQGFSTGAAGATANSFNTKSASNNSAANGVSGSSEAGPQTTSLGDDSRFKIAADESKNALIILASPEDYKRLLGVIQTLDQMPNQVLIEAVIAEVTLNDKLQFGVRFALQKGASTAINTNDIAGAVGSVFPGFSYLLKGATSQMTLHALASLSDVNVISSPSLVVLDNKTATLQVGDQVPISTQSSVSTLTVGAPVINSVSYRDTGVILSITPHINESGRVLLDIEQEVSSVAQTTSSNIDSPTIQQRKVKTSVVLNDNEALALGGIIQNKRSKSRDQIPVLGDLPIIGSVFKSKEDTVTKTELVILIVPRVIRSLGEANEVSQEFRDKLREIMPRAQPVSRDPRQTTRRILE